MANFMNNFKTEEISAIIQRGRDESVNPEIFGVIYSLGRDAENDEEYIYSFQTLLDILDGGTDRVRACCILGFSLLAVFHGKLDKNIIAPICKRERETAAGANLSTINSAIDDINLVLHWDL